jgi:hypothetical protein
MEQSSNSNSSPERVWAVSEIPATAGNVVGASMKIDVAATGFAVYILEARKGQERTPLSSVLVPPGETVAVLDATRLVRAHAAGQIDEVFLIRKPVDSPDRANRSGSGPNVQTDKINGVRLSTIVAPERRSRVRDILRGDRDPDIAQAPNAAQLPGKFGVKAYPNPFNPVTTIQVALPATADVDVTVYNVRGQRVKTLHSGKMKPGYNDLKWRGRDNRDNPVASGIYFYRVKAGTNLHTGKLMLLK